MANRTAVPWPAISFKVFFEFFPHQGIDGDERLIKEQQFRLHSQRLRDQQFLPCTGRIVLDQLGTILFEFEIFEKEIDLFPALGVGDPVKVLIEIEVLLAAQLIVEKGLVGNISDQPFQFVVFAVVGLAVDDDAAAVRGQKSGQDFQGGGFAGPIRPQQAVDLPRSQGKGDAFQRFPLAEPLTQILFRAW